jgi:cell wall-associated NlpC family hydrolase
MIDAALLDKAVYETMHWRFVPKGREIGAMDCVGWTRYILARVGVEIPDYEYGGSGDAAVFYENFHKHFRPTLTPRAGDVAFFARGGRHHMGVCMGGAVVAHCTEENGVVRQRADQMPLNRAKIEYYRPLGDPARG